MATFISTRFQQNGKQDQDIRKCLRSTRVMHRSDWKNLGVMTAVMSLAVAAYAAQPEPQPPKTPKAPQTYTFWTGDMQGSKGSYLGVDVTEISHDRVSTLKLKDEHGVEVTMVD